MDKKSEENAAISSREEILDARTAAANEIKKDPDMQPDPSSDDLDEGELARKDNSND